MQAYVTLVRPCLEYACSVWDPHTQMHCQDIEGVQRQAARFVKQNCYEREPGTVTNLLCPVVRTPVSANPGLNFNPGFFFFLSKAQLRIIFSILFRVSNHRIVGKEG